MNARQRRVACRANRAQVQAATAMWKARREALLARVLAGPIDNAGFAQSLRTLVQTDVSVPTAPVSAPAPRLAALRLPLDLNAGQGDTTRQRVTWLPLWAVKVDGSYSLVDEDDTLIVALTSVPPPV